VVGLTPSFETIPALKAIYHGLKFFFSFNVKRNKNHHPIINSVFVAATSAAYPQKGIPQFSGTYWLFRCLGTQPHGNLFLYFLQVFKVSKRAIQCGGFCGFRFFWVTSKEVPRVDSRKSPVEVKKSKPSKIYLAL
jgi:hypothetical protein